MSSVPNLVSIGILNESTFVDLFELTYFIKIHSIIVSKPNSPKMQHTPNIDSTVARTIVVVWFFLSSSYSIWIDSVVDSSVSS